MLELVIPTLDNQADYERLFTDPRVQRWLRPPPLPPIDTAEAARILRTDMTHWDDHGFGLSVVRDTGSGEFVGRAGISSYLLDGRPEVELAWAIVPERWGQGNAPEAARAAMAQAREVEIQELIAFTLPHNAASRRVMEKIGMSFAGPIEHAGLAHVLYRIAT
jgi:RimJ/RimL family protein N-acetyltransferase